MQLVDYGLKMCGKFFSLHPKLKTAFNVKRFFNVKLSNIFLCLSDLNIIFSFSDDLQMITNWNSKIRIL